MIEFISRLISADISFQAQLSMAVEETVILLTGLVFCIYG